MTTLTQVKRLSLLSAIAVVLGFAGGFAAWILLHLIRLLTNIALIHEFSFKSHSLSHLKPSAWLFVAAIAGALLVSIIAKWSPEIRGHGIPEAMEAILTRQSKIAPRTAIAKPISSAIAIGTGAPFGAEGPIIVTGGAIGSLLGQIIPVTSSERKILLAAGAAAGMSATFGAPLAAVVLAIELLLFEFSARAFIPLVVSSAIAGGMHTVFFGDGPLFHVPVHHYAGLNYLPAFVLLGVACGLFAIVISRGLFVIEELYRKLPISKFWHPVVGAIGFATVGLIVPRTLGVGYESIGDVLSSRLALGAVTALMFGKLISWWLALASGTSGGTLAPILMISASFGTLVGAGLNQILPGTDIALGAFAIVAMAATFGASTQATFTAIVFVFELTRDYQIILPLMLASVIADLIYSAVNEDSLMTEKLRRRGLRIGRHYSADPFVGTATSKIMTTSVITIPAESTIGLARHLFSSGIHSAYPIVEDSKVVGIITRGDMLGDQSQDEALLDEYLLKKIIVIKETDSAFDAMSLMVDENIEHIPVVDNENKLIGIVTRTDLLKVRRDQMASERISNQSDLKRKTIK